MAEKQGIINYDPATTNMVLDKMYQNRNAFPFDTEVKQDSEKGITSGAVYKALNDLGGGGTDDYNKLKNKPSINNVPLEGSKSLDDLGIQKKGNYATKEEMKNATPSIGENGNWYIGGSDTGKSSKGADGVSLGEIALVQETGTGSGSEKRVISQKVVSEKLSELEESVENIDNILQLSYQIYNGEYRDGYISTDGKVTASPTYKYSAPIYLAEGTKIEIEGYCKGAAFLSRTDESGTSYTPIYSPDGENLQKYSYVASSNEYVCVSYKISVSIKIYSDGKNAIEQINDRLDSVDTELDSLSVLKDNMPYIQFPFIISGLSSSGSTLVSNKRARTQYICSSIVNDVVSKNPEIELNVYYYDRDNKFIKASATFAQSCIIDNQYERFIVLARYKDERVITDVTDVYNNVLFYESGNRSIDMLRVGGINKDGVSNSDNNRCSFKIINTLCKIEIISDEIDYALRLFDEDGIFKYADEVWRHTPIIYARNSAIQFRYKDDRVIDLESVKKKIKITYVNEPYIYDGIETMSLKCVSEKNYNDGTIGIIKGCV